MSNFSVEWKGGYVFSSQTPTGATFVMDSHPEFGGQGLGPTPLEALLASTAACSGIDVISVLEKKKQNVTSYRIEIEWDRGPEGVYPRPITAMRLKHIVEGENIDPVAVARSVELADTKYCSIIATLRVPVVVASTWEIATPVS